MEQKETTTQNSPTTEEIPAANVKSAKDKSPTTTPTSSGASWASSWGGWINQAKEKVNASKTRFFLFTFLIIFFSSFIFVSSERIGSRSSKKRFK
jgi:hypothetical protein